MCTIVSETEAMVCDVSRDFVRAELTRLLGDGFTAETVHGEGTRFTCADPDQSPDFQSAIRTGQDQAAATDP